MMRRGLFLLLFLCGCMSAPPAKTPAEPAPQKVYMAPYEVVWRAAQLSLKYPVQINNMETGVLETEWIREPDGFRSPGETKKPSPGIRYKLRLLFVRGGMDGKKSTRVTVVKKTERMPDFFSEPVPVVSEVLEEHLILYRIERELQIEEGIRRANKQNQKT